MPATGVGCDPTAVGDAATAWYCAENGMACPAQALLEVSTKMLTPPATLTLWMFTSGVDRVAWVTAQLPLETCPLKCNCPAVANEAVEASKMGGMSSVAIALRTSGTSTKQRFQPETLSFMGLLRCDNSNSQGNLHKEGTYD